MKIANTRIVALLGLLAGLSLAFSANAAATWTFAGTGTTDANGEPLAKTSGYTSTVDGTLDISGAYALSGATGTGFASTTTWSTGAPNADTLFFSGGGLGMCSDPTNLTPTSTSPGCTAPNHAIDNVGNTEAILLTFSNSVVLNAVSVGFVSGDADISLFRYTGTSKTVPTIAPNLTGDLANKTSMIADGWELVGNYGDLTTAAAQSVNSGSKGSSWWLVSAYNTSYGAASSGAVDQGNDYFKLASITGTKCTSTTAGVCGGRVPEPGSLALASLALFGIVYTRRQVQQRKA